mgnify:CR=1 FL=1
MLRRDLRAGELGLLLVALIVAVASLTSVGFFTDRVAQALKYEANQLLGGDIVLVADHPLDPEWRAEAGRRGLQAVVSATFTSMASFGDGAQLAGVKVIEDGHPLRGAIRLAPGLNQPDAPAKGIPASGEVWLDERLASALGARPGDVIGLGASRFRMAAVLSFESDRGSNFFSLLPRLVINAVDLPATGLVQPGSRVFYRPRNGSPLRIFLYIKEALPAQHVCGKRPGIDGLFKYRHLQLLYDGEYDHHTNGGHNRTE